MARCLHDAIGPRASAPEAKQVALQSALTVLNVRVAALDRPDTPDEVVTAVRRLPADRSRATRRSRKASIRGSSAAFESRGIHQLYTHQAEAFEHVANGRQVVVTTPTASGKTLCYNLPVLDRDPEESAARALYLFPTKALAQDQMAELHELARSQSARSAARRSASTPTTATRRRMRAARFAPARTSC